MAIPEPARAIALAALAETSDRRPIVVAVPTSADAERLANARRAVDAAKIALGERGPVWWQDGAPDLNRHLVKNTPYRDWYEQQMRAQTRP